MKTIKIILLLLLSFKVSAMTPDQKIDQYRVQSTNPSLNAIKINMDFNHSEIVSDLPPFLDKVIIERIDLVYSTFKSSEGFNQEKLNNQRIKTLKRYCKPCINENIQWKSFGQTLAKNPEHAKKLFHGFVIYFRPIPSAISTKKEISFIDDFIKGDIKTPIIKSIKKSETTGTVIIKRNNLKKFIQDKLDEGYPYITYNYHGISPDKIKLTYEIKYYSGLPSYSKNDWLTSPSYDIVKSVFNRQPTWKKSVVLMDVTGSMAPYLAKTMAWIKETQKSNQVNAFVYFNDGDNKPDNNKIIGKVKGIYHGLNTNFETIYELMKKTMEKGNGGDIEENNVEALIYAQKHFPNQKEFVMVVDNWATPRDLDLLHLVKKPVHIIVCGAEPKINMAYINLAYKTGGSIHTIEEDLYLKDLIEGKKYKLGDTFFSLKSGKIIAV